MKTFDYIRPATIADAVAASAAPGAAYLASGTNLLDLMKTGVARPDRLIDINRLGLDEADIRVTHSDTDLAPCGGGTYASRTAVLLQ